MSRETLFTFVLDYRGGTYISQVSGVSLASAMAKWASTRTERDLTTWKVAHKQLAQLVEGDTPMALDGCQNVWCVSNSTEKGVMLLNVIATQSE